MFYRSEICINKSKMLKRKVGFKYLIFGWIDFEMVLIYIFNFYEIKIWNWIDWIESKLIEKDKKWNWIELNCKKKKKIKLILIEV